MLLELLFLGPIAIIAAAGVTFPLRYMGLVPPGVGTPLIFWLFGTVSFGALHVGVIVDDFVVRPARLQKELVGRQIGSPLQLQQYETYGFQDPHYEWRYSTRPELIQQLKSKCRVLPSPPRNNCLLAEQRDGSWWQGIGLEGDTVWVIGSDS